MVSRMQVFDAIANPTRRRLIETLAGGECNASRLLRGAGISQPAMSQQLAILKAAGLIAERKDGRFRFYTLNPEPLREVADWIERYTAFWNARLDAIGGVLDAMPKKRKRK